MLYNRCKFFASGKCSAKGKENNLSFSSELINSVNNHLSGKFRTFGLGTITEYQLISSRIGHFEALCPYHR